MKKEKFFNKVDKEYKPKDKNKALDEQDENLEYVCVGENKAGIRQYAVRKKGGEPISK